MPPLFDGEFDVQALVALAIDLVLALLLNQILSWHYVRCARTLSNRQKFARMFVLIGPTTLLVLASVKSSLALSLGLVGALSIVRFRTPIKEPEELAYLFLSIATGVGLGAGQRVLTVAGFVVVVGYAWLRDVGPSAGSPVRTILHVTTPMRADAAGSDELHALLRAVEPLCQQVDVRRVDRLEGELNASLVVHITSAEAIAKLLDGVRAALPGASVSVVEHEDTG